MLLFKKGKNSKIVRIKHNNKYIFCFSKTLILFEMFMIKESLGGEQIMLVGTTFFELKVKTINWYICLE